MKKAKLLKYLVSMMMMMMISGIVMGQNVTVTGRITGSDDGLPIPGASIVLKGTTRGVSTDVDGTYSITVPRGSTLQFSSIGMADQEVLVQDQTVIDIILQPSTVAVEEVVVTALGISREKKALGYSVTEVAGDKLTVSTNVSPVSALQGRASGVLITNTDGGVFGGTRINIRGNSTLGNNNQPIYIVDGVVIDNEVSGGSQWGGSDWGNNLKNLNPDDFETVSILKGAAATALYGSRALNGVILITTKKGRSTKGIGLEITHTTAIESVYAGQDFQNEFGVGGLAGYAYELPDRFAPMSSLPKNDDGEETVYLGDWGGFSWGPKMDGRQVRDYDDSWTTFSPQPDNMLQAFNLGIQNNTNVSLSGASGGTNYYASYSFKDHQGVYPGNGTKRNSLSVNVGQQLVKWLRLDVNMAYVTSDNTNPPSRSMYSEFIYSTFPRSYNTSKFYERYQAAHGGVPNQSYGDPDWNVPYNSLWFGIFENKSLQTEDNTRVRASVTANLTPWLTAKIGGDYNEYAIRGETKEPGQGYQNSGGYYSLSHSRKYQTSLDAQLIAQKEVFKDFNATIILGGENFYTINSGNRSWTNGGLVPPLVFSLSATKDTPGTEAWVNGERQLLSAYYIANLDYKGQFFLDLTGRNDWSSTMVYRDQTGHYSYFYPSFTGSWLFSETLEMPDFIDFGKLRLAYAIVGTGADPYEITNPFTYTRGGTLNTFNGAIPYYTYSTTTVPNPDLEPEKKHELEFGFDVRFFKNRLGLDLTLYNNHTYNQILSNSVPGSSGVSAIIFNAGDIQNKGIELTLHTTPVRTADITWDADFNFTRNRNMIIELYPGIDLYNLYESATYGNTRIGTYAVVGGEWGVLMSDSEPLRDEETGLPILRWSSGNRGVLLYRSNEMKEVGSMNPDFFGSVNSTITWKNFQLGFLIDAKIGGMISSYHGRYGAGLGVFESTLANRTAEHGGVVWTSPWTGQTYEDGIIPEGIFAAGTTIVMKDPDTGVETTNNVGGMTYAEAIEQGMAEPTHVSYWVYQTNSWGNGVINENVLMENSYISFRELSLGYRIPGKIASRIGSTGINVLVYARNLGYLYNTMTNHLHPEAQTSNNAGAAHEWMQIPYSRTMGIKLNLSF